MAGRLALFFGVTGTGKRYALERLRRARQEGERGKIEVLDLEDDFIKEHLGFPIHAFLDQPSAAFQQEIWRRAMTACQARVEELLRDGDVYLGMHAAILREEYGVRSVVSVPTLAGLRPHAIMTFIDDLYSAWHRTETRGDAHAEKGKPTLEHLISGRRFEVFLGDFLAQQIATFDSTHAPKHYLLATQHPCEAALRLLYNPSPRRIYVSFPISEPRRLLRQGDRSGIETIDEFIRTIFASQRANPHLCFFVPLTIDELPLRFIYEDPSRAEKHKVGEEEQEFIKLNKDDRWSLPYPTEVMIHDGADLPESILLPKWQVEEVRGSIKNDIRTRDYRYIDQADAVAVFNPYFVGHRSSGVWAEMAYAIRTTKPVIVFQDSRHAGADQLAELRGDGSPDSPFRTSRRYMSVFIDNSSGFMSTVERR